MQVPYPLQFWQLTVVQSLFISQRPEVKFGQVPIGQFTIHEVVFKNKPDSQATHFVATPIHDLQAVIHYLHILATES